MRTQTLKDPYANSTCGRRIYLPRFHLHFVYMSNTRKKEMKNPAKSVSFSAYCPSDRLSEPFAVGGVIAKYVGFALQLLVGTLCSLQNIIGTNDRQIELFCQDRAQLQVTVVRISPRN